jgi:hypothetical protein
MSLSGGGMGISGSTGLGVIYGGERRGSGSEAVLPDIPIPPPDNDIELDLRHQLLETSENLDLPQTSSDYPTSVLEVLIKVGGVTSSDKAIS